MKVRCKDFEIVSIYVGSRIQNKPQYGYKIVYKAPDGSKRAAKGTYYTKATARKAISEYVKMMNYILKKRAEDQNK